MASVLVLVPFERTLRPSFFRRFFGVFMKESSFLSGSGKRMEFRHRFPYVFPDITTPPHQLSQTREAEILFSVPEFDGDCAGDERTHHDQRVVAERTLRKCVLIVEELADSVNDPPESVVRGTVQRKTRRNETTTLT